MWMHCAVLNIYDQDLQDLDKMRSDPYNQVGYNIRLWIMLKSKILIQIHDILGFEYFYVPMQDCIKGTISDFTFKSSLFSKPPDF